MRVQSLGGEDTLEEGMATHSSILAWRVSQTKEPGRPQSIELQSQTRLSDSVHTGYLLFHRFSCDTQDL